MIVTPTDGKFVWEVLSLPVHVAVESSGYAHVHEVHIKHWSGSSAGGCELVVEDQLPVLISLAGVPVSFDLQLHNTLWNTSVIGGTFWISEKKYHVLLILCWVLWYYGTYSSWLSSGGNREVHWVSHWCRLNKGDQSVIVTPWCAHVNKFAGSLVTAGGGQVQFHISWYKLSALSSKNTRIKLLDHGVAFSSPV